MWTSSLRWPAHQEPVRAEHFDVEQSEILSRIKISIESIEPIYRNRIYRIYLSNYLLLLYLISIKVRHQLTCRHWGIANHEQLELRFILADDICTLLLLFVGGVVQPGCWSASFVWAGSFRPARKGDWLVAPLQQLGHKEVTLYITWSARVLAWFFTMAGGSGTYLFFPSFGSVIAGRTRAHRPPSRLIASGFGSITSCG